MQEKNALLQASMTINQIYEGLGLSDEKKDLVDFYNPEAAKQVNSFIESNGAKDSVIDQFNPLKYRRYNELLNTFQTQYGNTKPLQVVYLASGLSNYAQQAVKSGKQNIQFFEIDYPSILDFKENIASYAEKNFAGKIKYVRTDYLTNGIIKPLQEKGIDLTLPTLFIWQGQIANLTQAQIEKVLAEINDNFQAEISIGLDYFSEQLVSKKTGIEQIDNLMSKLATAFEINFITGFNESKISQLMGKYGFHSNKVETGNILAEKYHVKPFEPSLEHAAVYTGTRLGKG